RGPGVDEQHHENGQHGAYGPQQAGAQLDQVGNESVLRRGCVLCHVGVPVFVLEVSSKPGSGSVVVSCSGAGASVAGVPSSAGGSDSGSGMRSCGLSCLLSDASAL